MMQRVPGDAWQKAATLRALYAYMFVHPGKKLLFMGNEIGQWHEWNHDGSIEWSLLDHPLHAGLQRFVQDLNVLYRREHALYERDFEPAGFEWIDCNDHESSVISLIRRAANQADWLVGVVNWTPLVRTGYRVGVPEAGEYEEVLNSDAAAYGGGNVGNLGRVTAESVAAHGRSHSLVLTLPPLGAIVLKLRTSKFELRSSAS
jgi:1,4-alpha-glucan branching enzyme